MWKLTVFRFETKRKQKRCATQEPKQYGQQIGTAMQAPITTQKTKRCSKHTSKHNVKRNNDGLSNGQPCQGVQYHRVAMPLSGKFDSCLVADHVDEHQTTSSLLLLPVRNARLRLCNCCLRRLRVYKLFFKLPCTCHICPGSKRMSKLLICRFRVDGCQPAHGILCHRACQAAITSDVR